MQLGIEWVPSAGAQIKTLVDTTHKPDLDSVHKTSYYYKFDYGADYTVQSLICSGCKVLTSLEQKGQCKQQALH